MSHKILVVSRSFWPEQSGINEICRGLAERGYEVDVLCGHPCDEAGRFLPGYSMLQPKQETFGKVQIMRSAQTKRGAGSSIETFLYYLSFPLSSRMKVRKLLKKGYEKIFVWQTSPLMMDTAAMALRRKSGIQLVMWVQEIWPGIFFKEQDIQNPILRRFFTNYSERHYRSCDRLIVSSQKALDYFVQELDIPKTRVRMIPPVPDPVYFRPEPDGNVRERYAGSFNIVFAGSMTDDMDFRTMLEAAQMVREAGIRDIRFVAASESGRIRQLQKEADRRQLGDLFFCEKVRDRKDLSKFLAVADALICCRKLESLDEYSVPEQVIHYLASGKPILAAEGSEARMLLRRAGCGYAAEPENVQDLYQIILRMYHLPKEKLDRMGGAALDLQKREYSPEQALDAVIEALFAGKEESGRKSF